MTKGLQASGKSTWAKAEVDKSNGQLKRVNKDDLRSMIDNSKWSKNNEKFILKIRNSIIKESINNGFSIIIDDTNLDPKHETDLKAMAELLNTDFKIKDFTDIPLSICLERDSKRSNIVGKKVIIDTYNRYLKPKIKKFNNNFNLPVRIICDLDGTLAINEERSPYDTANCDKDELNLPIAEVIKNFQTIFVSGRMEKFRGITEKWLSDNGFSKPVLFMRPDEDVRNDAIIKKEIYDKEIKGKYNILFAIDDRKRIKRMWVENGIFVLDVNQFDEEF